MDRICVNNHRALLPGRVTTWNQRKAKRLIYHLGYLHIFCHKNYVNYAQREGNFSEIPHRSYSWLILFIFYFFVNSHLKIFFPLLSQRDWEEERKGEWDWEKYQWKRDTLTVCLPLIPQSGVGREPEPRTPNLGTCPWPKKSHDPLVPGLRFQPLRPVARAFSYFFGVFVGTGGGGEAGMGGCCKCVWIPM